MIALIQRVREAAVTVDGGEMTPTMKLKRNVINDKYKDVIDGFYA